MTVLIHNKQFQPGTCNKSVVLINSDNIMESKL